MPGYRNILVVLVVLAWSHGVFAHPTIENVMEVVIDRQKITIDARISMEEVLLVEVDPTAPRDYWPTMVESHGDYLLKKLTVLADGKPVGGKVILATAPAGSGAPGLLMATYRLEYPLDAPPRVVGLWQDFLREYSNWSASFVVKIRQSYDTSFETSLLTREKKFMFDCEWPAENGSATAPVTAAQSKIKFGETLGSYTVHGIGHIIGPITSSGWNWREAGFDHLLFATALVLATRRLWDLMKVVTAFTLAHTITLTLSVLNLVSLSKGIVEPMIAASIVFVAVQNVFWPKQSRGRLRLVLAFSFGLFHGLGFAGGLKEAMSGMPGVGLAAALIGFSLGVEVGHQVVVLPLFGVMAVGRRWAPNGEVGQMSEVAERGEGKGVDLFGWVTRGVSAAVGVCGAWYFVVALRQ